MNIQTVSEVSITWGSLAETFGCGIDQFLEANGLDSTSTALQAQPGMLFIVPSRAEPVHSTPDGKVTVDDEAAILNRLLELLAVQTQNFAKSFINDASVRQNYIRKVAELSETILSSAKSGQITYSEAAIAANNLRNQVLMEARQITSSIGRAQAESAKAVGKTMQELIDKTVEKSFPGRRFADLANAERQAVFAEIVAASGRSRPSFTSAIPKLRVLGGALVVISVAISVYTIWTAENKARAALREVVVFGSGFIGGALAGAATGLVCGPGAPFCAAALFIVGGIAGSIAGSMIDAELDEQIPELASWIGE